MASIFIVEDEAVLAKVYRLLLSYHGHDVIGIAHDGIDALEMYKGFSNPPDIVLMDHRMPSMDGISVAREIIDIDPNTKIIFTTADSDIREKALKIGAKSFKNKPFTLHRLLSNIEKALHDSG